MLHEFSHSWTIGEAKELTVTRLEAALQAPECWQDLAVLRLVHGTESGPSSGLRPGFLVRAATFGLGGAEAPVEHVSVRLEVQRRRLTLYGLEVVSGALPASDGGLAAALEALPLDSLRWLRWGGPGATALWRDPALLARLASTLARLDLRGAALGTLPPGVGALRALRSLDVSGCGLKILPPALGLLTDLRRLRADGNEISLLPGELARCTALRTLSLEGNRLTHVPLNFGALRAARAGPVWQPAGGAAGDRGVHGATPAERAQPPRLGAGGRRAQRRGRGRRRRPVARPGHGAPARGAAAHSGAELRHLGREPALGRPPAPHV